MDQELAAVDKIVAVHSTAEVERKVVIVEENNPTKDLETHCELGSNKR
jgi:hypothetical protein